MSCIASAVGLGNIWRFPFIAGQNGGGAFLIPYLLVLTVIGRPLYLMELGLGQFASAGPIKIWELCPAFRGVGYGAALASFFVTTFYVCVMGWALVYFLGYSWTLPWRSPEYHNNPGIFFGLAFEILHYLRKD
jgi:solute carrier family 6 amino acid transporter-like protein 5/7/9/14